MARYITFALVFACYYYGAHAWEQLPPPGSHRILPRPPQPQSSLQSRRQCFQKIVSAAFGVASVATLSPTQSAGARDELFRKNPLTNPVLEQMRIWEQAEADELKYGGELERGDAGNKGKVDAYPRMLVPILGIAADLERIETLVGAASSSSSSSVEAWKQAREILAKPEYEKVQFKKIFNRYGDNIYYSDPDRANMYLGGGATPKSEQSVRTTCLAWSLKSDQFCIIFNPLKKTDFVHVWKCFWFL